MNKKTEQKNTGIDIGIICSIVGIIASIVLIILNLINNDNLTMGIILLCSCSINLIANIRRRDDKKE